MATSVPTVIQRTRRFVRDWPDFDVLTASCTSSSATLTVADATIYPVRGIIQIDSEAMRVTTNAAGTSLGVRRGVNGTTAATHANAATVLQNPRFLDIEILDALNAGLSAAFPLLYKPVSQEYTGVLADVYEYDVPDMTGFSTPIPYIYKLEYMDASGLAFQDFTSWRVIRAATPIIKLRRALPAGGTLRINGYGPFVPLTAAGDLDDLFPPNAEDLLVWFAAQYLLASGEAFRVAVDAGPIDNREQANRTGSSMAASNALFQRFQLRLRDAGMPPLPRHVVSTF